jgi:hypothetical protein
VISTVYGLNTSRQVWSALANRYAAPSKTRIQDLRCQLQILRQGDKPCSEYVCAAKSLADQLAMVGKPVSDEDLISYIISGLSPRYNAFCAMHAQKVHSNNRKRRFNNKQRQNQPRFSNQKGNFSSPHKKVFNSIGTSPQGKSNSRSLIKDTNRPPCQICGKNNHQALDCFHRMDYAYQDRHPPSELAAMVSQSNALRGDDD